ncbi:hypothetical protein [Paractinoplanes maris]|uniref:hypothetical protein n=1 Tax=Paractinoplanes maris TaxID=1734446 RepID=UPI0020219F5D|nr:hypothetical protein [Actinoplanes maris]
MVRVRGWAAGIVAVALIPSVGACTDAGRTAAGPPPTLTASSPADLPPALSAAPSALSAAPSALAAAAPSSKPALQSATPARISPQSLPSHFSTRSPSPPPRLGVPPLPPSRDEPPAASPSRKSSRTAPIRSRRPSPPAPKLAVTWNLTSVLSRDEAVPAGVQAQLSFFIGGSNAESPCRSRSGFGISVVDEVLSAPGFATICANGLRPGQTVEVSAYAPSGRIVQSWEAVPVYESSLTLRFRRMPYDEPGVYRFQLTQQKRSASTTAPLRPVSSPALIPYLDDDQESFEAAEPPFRVAVGGFPPYAEVPMRLYGAEKRIPGGTVRSRYLTTFPIRMDSRGFALWELRTFPGDPRGCYRLALDGIPETTTRLRFCLPDGP